MKSDDGKPRTLYEEYLALDFSDLEEASPALPLDRRQFLKLVGGGIVITITVPSVWSFQERQGRRRGGQANRPQFLSHQVR